MTAKVTARQLYAEMDKNIPGWRLASYPSFDAAVVAAGPLAVDICSVWRAGFERKTNSRMASADARKATNERLAQEIREKEDDSPVFDKGRTGRHVAAEWSDGRSVGEFQPGFTDPYGASRQQAQMSDDDEDDSQSHRGAAIGFYGDRLLGDHPVRKAAPWSIEAFRWDPVAPRSYDGSPKCY